MLSHNFIRRFHNIKYHRQYEKGDVNFEPIHKKTKLNGYYYHYIYRYRFLPELAYGMNKYKYNEHNESINFELDYWDFEYYGQWWDMIPRSYAMMAILTPIVLFLSFYYFDYQNMLLNDSPIFPDNPFPSIDSHMVPVETFDRIN